MKTIVYTIEFFSEWHCGSGLAAGSDVDALVIKDANGLPFVPGKTIKGLVRENLETIPIVDPGLETRLKEALGFFLDVKEDMLRGETYFTDAVFPEEDQKLIVGEKLQHHLFREAASTAIDEHGIAAQHSLRRIQTTVPCTLQGKILDVPDELYEAFKNALLLVKRAGLNRNRGLGRCDIRLYDNN